jgi:hypothetical protein
VKRVNSSKADADDPTLIEQVGVEGRRPWWSLGGINGSNF